MNHRALTLLGILFLLCLTAIGAEDSGLPQPASLKLPKGNGAWIIQIHRTGGIVGKTSDITISSDGRVACEPAEARCGERLSLAQLQTWSDLVFNVPVLKSPYFISG